MRNLIEMAFIKHDRHPLLCTSEFPKCCLRYPHQSSMHAYNLIIIHITLRKGTATHSFHKAKKVILFDLNTKFRWVVILKLFILKMLIQTIGWVVISCNLQVKLLTAAELDPSVCFSIILDQVGFDKSCFSSCLFVCLFSC